MPQHAGISVWKPALSPLVKKMNLYEHRENSFQKPGSHTAGPFCIMKFTQRHGLHDRPHRLDKRSIDSVLLPKLYSMTGVRKQSHRGRSFFGPMMNMICF